MRNSNCKPHQDGFVTEIKYPVTANGAIQGRLFSRDAIDLYSKGNIVFSINRILVKAVLTNKATEFSNRADSCKSYDEILNVCLDYVEFADEILDHFTRLIKEETPLI